MPLDLQSNKWVFTQLPYGGGSGQRGSLPFKIFKSTAALHAESNNKKDTSDIHGMGSCAPRLRDCLPQELQSKTV